MAWGRFGLVWFGLVWFGSVRFGSVRFGSVRFGRLLLRNITIIIFQNGGRGRKVNKGAPNVDQYL
jgi:hypothetical protein